MKDEILALLVAMFAGVRKDGLSQLARSMALQASTKDEAVALVEKLTEAQVNEFVKEYRSEVDKEATEARKTYEANLKKKFELVEKKANELNDGGNGGGDDIATKLDALLDAKLKPLQEKLSKYEQGDIAKSRLQSLSNTLSGCKDETFKAKAMKDFARMKFDTDEDFNEYLTDTGTDLVVANQNVANAALGNHGTPLFTQKEESGISRGVAEFVASQKPDGTVLSGKEI